MKKVLLVAPLPPPYGGISHWTSMVVRKSRDAGNIPLSVIDTAPRHRAKFERSFLSQVLKGLPGLFRQIRQGFREMTRKDLLALHVITTGHYALVRDLAFLLLAKAFDRRSILHVRSGRLPRLLESHRIESVMFRVAIRVASHIMAIDEATGRAISMHFPNAEVSVVPNCIDIAILPQVPAKKLPVIVFVGWVLPAKGIEELLRAWAKVRRPNWHLKIIGPYSDEYMMDLANRYDLSEVEFTGEYENPDVLTEIANAAIMCLPSHTEGFPNVLIEAMALECAVVATSVGAIPEMLADGAGVIIDKEDHNALADKLVTLMEDPQIRDRMAARASQRARTEFALDVVYERYETIWLHDPG